MTVWFLFWRKLDRSENHNKDLNYHAQMMVVYLTFALYCDWLSCMARTREDTKWLQPFITFQEPLSVEKKQLNNWINFSNYYWEEWHLWLYRYRSLQAYVSNDEQCSLSSSSCTISNSTPKKDRSYFDLKTHCTDWKQLRNLTKIFYVFQSKPKLYIPSTLNIDLILWHTQLIVCAVKC